MVVLVQKRFPTASPDRILYFHAAKSDPLLHDAVGGRQHREYFRKSSKGGL
ncbi:MAG: hypothetical protein ACYC6N_00795 [Pirellulaceae bacterium]